ncbi:MAG: formate dehydrogenase subunit beta [Paracoccus sp. (in: a-proteobacteria)]|uniref:formate dehydrogenase subunit beta n=1 Tax=Paracoccus sp. TaxID=267 RepID=UPI0026E02CFC|nr:formate dehydrogenase subunit beta [Paracoccus sp. (in: a-proteobacteria)]MDO5622292.1 formate dehydrogenase subunit beta [Paracoccus sp. (in: a-proteobacteria)]
MTDTFQHPNKAMSNPPVQPQSASFGAGDVIRASATPNLPQPERQLPKVAKLIDISKCIGCKACQSACVEWNELDPEIGTFEGTYTNPMDLTPDMFTLMRFEEWVNPATNDFEWLIRKDGCMHCEDPGCLKSCPAPGAIVQYSNGIVDFIHENCIGCGYCITGCPFNIPRVSQKDHKSYKCTLCSDRVAVGQGPACAKACPTEAIIFGNKDDMKAHAEARLEDLKSRGYENPTVYDPQGVGGTHVMYVLPHGETPSIYAGLPDDPKISEKVDLWKGGAKTVGVAAMGAAAAGAALLAFFGRPNKVEPEDEIHAQQLVDNPSEEV